MSRPAGRNLTTNLARDTFYTSVEIRKDTDRYAPPWGPCEQKAQGGDDDGNSQVRGHAQAHRDGHSLRRFDFFPGFLDLGSSFSCSLLVCMHRRNRR
jgi:hypothetical protein